MKHFTIHLDYHTSERAGAGGMFQVIDIIDADGNDVTDQLVNVGTHYTDQDALRQDILARLGAPSDEVTLEEV